MERPYTGMSHNEHTLETVVSLYKLPTRNHLMIFFHKTQCMSIFMIVVLVYDMTSTKGIEFSGQGAVRFSPDFSLPGCGILEDHPNMLFFLYKEWACIKWSSSPDIFKFFELVMKE